MARNIFTVSAYIVDANGTKNNLSGYPADFDSNSYQGDVEKARKRASGSAGEAWGAMCKNDTRQIQTVTVTNIFGDVLEKKTMGGFPEEPEPQPEPQPEPEAEGEE